jgi:hypothetical protein
MKTTTIATALVLSLCTTTVIAAPRNAQTQVVLDQMIDDPAKAYGIGLLSITADRALAKKNACAVVIEVGTSLHEHLRAK